MDPCTEDACDSYEGCIHTFVLDAPCSDYDECTAGDRCVPGGCEGTPMSCDDGDACTAEVCIPHRGCRYELRSGASCDDGDACTENDRCRSFGCRGDDIACNDQDPCTDDSCDPVTGCTYAPNTLPCDDGNACTHSDT